MGRIRGTLSSRCALLSGGLAGLHCTTLSSFASPQITKREKNNLMAILPYYKAYVKERGGRSLLQYLSCHSMRLRWQWSGKVYFVVMRNFFPAAPQLSFDLKGASCSLTAPAADRS